MIISLQKIKNALAITSLSVSLILLVFSPQSTYASQSIYTIQTGSFPGATEAGQQYDFIMNKLNKQEIDYLRIEKVGKFYAVRLGKFENYPDSEKLYRAVKIHVSKAVIMKAYMKNERIIKLYTGLSSVNKQGVKEKTALVPEKTKPRTTEKAENHEKEMALKEKIAKIKSLVEKNAFNSALDLLKAEIAAQPDHPDLNAWIGMVLIKMNQPLEAQKYLRKATELSPNVSDYHNGLGYSLYFLKKYDEAIYEFNKSISIDPEHLDALVGLYMVYAETGNKEKNLEIYDRLKDLDKETSDKLLKIFKTTM
ncbi:MAG: tetratricopeptide repeat protein [Nitrospira sp.]|nr:tetratricopeptide repeat protein [Nitrospira sp.]